MGLLDSMFGGGTNLQLALDNSTSSPGSVVGGRIALGGGKKPLKLTELAVQLLFVSVKSRSDGLPDIDARAVAKQVIAANGDIPAGSQQSFTFRIQVPSDLPPTAHNISYQVVATADIPGVKDPSAKADLKVVEASRDDHRRISLQDVLARFPNLQSRDEEQLKDALYEFFLACYSEGAQLMEAEQLIAHHMMNGTVEVRRKALEAWANLVDNRVQPHHLQTLHAIAQAPGLDDQTFEQVIIAATKFAEEGALPLVQQLAQDTRSDVRAKVAQNLRFNAAEKFNGKRELLTALAQDTAPDVRRAAVSALSCYRDDQQIVHWIASIADGDSDPDVQAECMSTLSLVHYHGMGELALAVYEKHTQNPNARVRSQIAQSLSSQPPEQMQRIWAIAQKLAADSDEEVRRSLAFQFSNMEKLPQLLPIAQHMAQSDPSSDVRREAIGSMGSLMPPAQAAHFYAQLMSQARSEDEMWPVLNGLRRHSDNADVKRLLSQMGQCPFPNVANAAREALS